MFVVYIIPYTFHIVHPATNSPSPLFAHLRPQAVSGKSREAILQEVGGMSWGAFKPVLAEAVVAHLQPVQQRYAEVGAALTPTPDPNPNLNLNRGGGRGRDRYEFDTAH